MKTKHNLIILEQAGSTQDIAYQMARDGASEGVAVMTCDQTSGRGRLGRNWVSPKGKNLALSLILRPTCEPKLAPLYGLMTAVAAASTVEQFCAGARVQVKWPNDVVVGVRKIAGILPQALINGHVIEFVIIGLGLNVNSTETDFPEGLRDTVTSTLCLSSRIYDVVELAGSFLDHMSELYSHSVKNGFEDILDLWLQKWAHRGCMVIQSGIEGVAETIDELGALVVRKDDGSLIKVSSGEVNF